MADAPEGPWDSTSDQNHLAVADWSVAADGNITLVCAGTSMVLGANGTESSLLMSAANTVSIVCGSAALLLSTEEGEESGAFLGAGPEGSVALSAGPEEEGSFAEVSPESVTLQVGVTDTGSQIQLTPESIRLQVGPPGAGASIEITPESITIKVAEVTFTMTAEGITEDVAEVTRETTAEGHNFTAAETEFNVGVQGQTAEGPTVEEEVEAGTVENETLGSDTTDAAKNTDAGIMVTE